jgi:DNA modification methylase
MIPEAARKYVYYEEPGIVLLHGDCLEILPMLEEGSIDLVLTDPPYGIGVNKMNLGGGGVAPHKHFQHDKSETWDDKGFDIVGASFCIRVSKEQILWGANHYAQYLPNSRGWLVWDKRGAEQENQFKNDFADCELAWSSISMPIRKLKHLWNGMWQENMAKKEKRMHPTQKPVRLMEWCLNFVPDANLILDPFLGSGTTAVAAKQLGRKCIGIEIESKYLDIAIERLRQEQLF